MPGASDGFAELLDPLGCPWEGEPGEPLWEAGFRKAVRAGDSPLAASTRVRWSPWPSFSQPNVALAHAFKPAVFDGDVLLFTASLGKTGQAPGREDWAPYLTGGLRVRPVECTHGEMSGRRPTAEIGQVIAAGLAGQPAADARV
ncbi:MAG TPA: hypothetical protein DEQ61_21075 [Streptomyces sp.]|nr:hypothetical protein [Streptomyces sp.]